MSWPVLAYATCCIFLAAIVRGYSGFGFSLLAITALSLAMAPAETVPSIFMLEIAASLHLLPGIFRDIHWRSIGPLILGCLVATPFGVYLLANLPAAPMKLALAAFVLAATILLYSGFALSQMPGRIASTAVGAASGFFNGAFGIGGPPVILFYFSSPAGHATSRASVIAYFLATDLIGLAFLAREHLVTAGSAWRASIFLPALLAGIWLGARSFKGADPARFQRWVLVILAALAVLTALQALGAGEAWPQFAIFSPQARPAPTSSF
jgi:uncharacterized protein